MTPTAFYFLMKLLISAVLAIVGMVMIQASYDMERRNNELKIGSRPSYYIRSLLKFSGMMLLIITGVIIGVLLPNG